VCSRAPIGRHSPGGGLPVTVVGDACVAALGYDLAQGYLSSRPVDAETVRVFMTDEAHELTLS
jgi:hypothetical protein